MNSTPVPKLLFILLLVSSPRAAVTRQMRRLTPDAAVSPPDGQDGASTLPVSVPDKSGSGGSAPSTVATPLGLQCARDQDCGSGHCTDGVCCDTACDGICQSCALTGKLGACAPVADATDDTCNGASTCDATGACREGLGGPCAAGSDCASGSCVDGICCGSATCGTCQSCGLPGSRGHCAPVPPLTDDVDSACAGDTTCNGLGACDRKNGQACAGATDCASRQCVDGICCATTCEGTCYACNVSGKEGACAPITRVEDPAAATPCTGASYCDAHPDHAPVCLPKLADGVPCTFALQCESGVCGTYYVDADNDGYGLRAVTTCGRRPAPGASAVGGDCCDSAANVNPGITTFSVVPNACGKFDFNCDGIEERVNGKTVPCGTGIRIMLSKLNGIDTRVGCR